MEHKDKDITNIEPLSFKWRHISPGNMLRNPIENPEGFAEDYKTPYRYSRYFQRKLSPEYETNELILGKISDSTKSHLKSFNIPALDELSESKNVFDIRDGDIDQNIYSLVRGVHNVSALNFLHHELNIIGKKPVNAYKNQELIVNNSGYERVTDALEGNQLWNSIYFDATQMLYDIDQDLRENHNYRENVYVGKTKKWQTINDCFGKDEVNKIQIAIRAPLQEQLDLWEEENNKKYIQYPISNENQAKFRDTPEPWENLDHDYDNIIYERERNQVWESLRHSRVENHSNSHSHHKEH